MNLFQIEYSNLLYFLRRGNRKYLITTIIIFLIVFYISYIAFTDILNTEGNGGGGGSEYKDFTVNSFLDFFINNAKVFVLMSVGFGVITFISLVYQAYSLGMLYSVWLHEGLSFKTFALLTIPHGIFEIPALFIAGSIGFRSLTLIIQYLKRKELNYQKEFEQIVYNLILVIFLTFLAAIVEFYVTQGIAQ
ncbi:stage II sporulation protein M [Bacillus sp. CGMCC 1.60114]|uniref:stage II sporulation protein M n=1 Tax=unclassified Bacillus (in: firmicutes) TaxID=185979 RepID=UPI003644B9BB